MTLSNQIESLLKQHFPGAHISVNSGDDVHFLAKIAAPQFAGLSRVQQQQKVYAVLGDLIASGKVHALSLRTQALWGA